MVARKAHNHETRFESDVRNKCSINVQVQSAVKVGEESEVATNIQLYEIKQMSFTIKLVLQNESAFITASLG